MRTVLHLPNCRAAIPCVVANEYQVVNWVLVSLGFLLSLSAFVATGWWRYAFGVFAISPKRMTVDKLELRVQGDENIARVNEILANFIRGFNSMIARPSPMAWKKAADTLPSLYRPFWHEGAAMGHTLRHLFRYDAAGFEREIVRPNPEFRYLYYVGLGFWSGMRNHSSARVMKIAEDLDPMHRFLVFDGYGFKLAFFDHPQERSVLRRLDEFTGYARNAAYQGVGRAMYFRFMSEPELMMEEIRRLDDHAPDAAAGLGLAAVFVNPDRLHVAQELGRQVPRGWQPHFHLGMCFGLKARSINDVDAFERNMSLAPRAVAEAVGVAVRECDRVELLVRDEKRPDGYEQWRRRVTEWLVANVEYPMARAVEKRSVSPIIQVAKTEAAGVSCSKEG